MGHVLSPWWVTGPAYAEGTHEKGYTGVVYSAPYDCGGADVQILSTRTLTPIPWFCGCDRLTTAFFAAAANCGPGWRWRRTNPRSQEKNVILHCFLDVTEALGEDSGHDLLKQACAQAVVPYAGTWDVQVDLRDNPEPWTEGDRLWQRYQVIVSRGSFTLPIPYGVIDVVTGVRLVVLSVLE